MNYRVILYHKQATSARTRFVRFACGVCAFEGLPPLAQVHCDAGDPALHPAPVLQRTAGELGLKPAELHAEESYHFSVEVPGERLPVLLLGIDTIDPPFEEVKRVGGEFIDLTQARDLTPPELELLRGAYEAVLGG